ncbi:terminase small subunit [Cytobacillus praedii]|uniref:Terminase small subunit n=1 Tax=Cytobacillus praedii TaxID=1742358 RepID=A0A4R1AWM6_9BACI|nr:terminase small subunit [Cytobacillus praedii]TCJ01505.1 terminase small subunit [Cytobacillus praedii]
MLNWEEVRNEFESTKITLAALAEKNGIKLGTLKSRKSREGWSRVSPKKDATQSEKDATPKQRMQPKKEVISKEETVEEITLDNFLEDSDLTEKQRLFCLYYVRSFNATQAAINAGYVPVSAHVEGSRLLRNAKVAAEIKRIKQTMTSELYLEAMDVLNKYIKIAFSDITDFLTFGQKMVPVIGMMGPVIDEHGKPVMEEVNYVDFKESGIVDGTIISEVKQGKDGVSIKLEDRMKALDKLSLYFDLFPDKFKRQIEEEKLKIAHHKVFGGNEEEEYESDGFEEALNATTSEVWADVDSTTEEDN